MVIKGKSVAGAKRLAAHLQRTDTNERLKVAELRGVAAEDLKGALREMEAVASGCPNCEKPFYHASINTRADEPLTDAQRMAAIDRLEKELGLSGQPRIVVIHEKKDREHYHIGWSRIDAETMRAISDSHNYRKHEKVARELEREFGHERVQGAHIERDGVERPKRTPSHKEHQQAERTGIKPKEAKALMTALWHESENGKEFRATLEKKGWTLAKGDRRDFVVLDPKGGVHSLARRIEGAKLADVRGKLADLDPKTIPTLGEARKEWQARQPAKTRERAPRVRNPARQGPQVRGGRVLPAGGAKVTGAAGGALKAASKVLDGVASAFENLLGGASPPPPKKGGKSQDDDLDRPPLDRGPLLSETQRAEALHREQDAASQQRQSRMREFSREVPDETGRDVEIERDRKAKDGGRERTRGE